MRQPDRGGGGGRGRFVRAQPRPLGHGERRARHAADPLGPRGGPAPLRHQPLRLRRGPYVVPQQRGPHRRARRVQRDQTVLLPGHGHRARLPRRVPALSQRLGERRPPVPRIALLAHLAADGVRGPAAGDDRAGCRVHHQHLGGLRRAVHADDERSRCLCAHRALSLRPAADRAVRPLCARGTPRCVPHGNGPGAPRPHDPGRPDLRPGTPRRLSRTARGRTGSAPSADARRRLRAR